MRPSLTICLLLSSSLLFSGCAISKYHKLSCQEENSRMEPVINRAGVQKYKASIDVLKNHLTGLLIVKQTDSVTKHLVFVTELGMKMFDLEAKDNQLKAVYVFEPLNKPLFIESLVRNFSNMFLLNTEGRIFKDCKNRDKQPVVTWKQGKDTWYYTGSGDDDSKKIYPRLQETFHKSKRSSKIEYVVGKQGIWYYSQIKCKQYGLVKFYFELNAIPPSND